MRIFIDIETRPSEALPALETIKVDGRLKDPEKVRQAQEEGQLEAWYKEALDSRKGQVLCVCATIDKHDGVLHRTMLVNNVSEQLLFTELEDFIATHVKKGVEPTWIGHNIKGFDLPWLYQKGLKCGCKELLRTLPTQRYSKNIFDTMEMWNPWDYKSYIKLQDMAEYFGLSGKTLTLEQQKEIWLNPSEEGYNQIADYCENDVQLVVDIYNIMK